ncbi:MAG: hypothetical protein WAL90_00300 [Desulfobacterales bacterium]
MHQHDKTASAAGRIAVALASAIGLATSVTPGVYPGASILKVPLYLTTLTFRC